MQTKRHKRKCGGRWNT